jgi:hypothetical protein
MYRKLLAGFVLTVAVFAVFAVPASAGGDGPPRSDRRISVSGGVYIAQAEVVTGPLVSIEGRVIIDGTVTDNVFVVSGDLDIRGRVTGDVLVVFLIFLWVAVTVSVAILGLLFVLLFPRAADATVAAGRRFWPTVGWGALVGIAGPILGVLVLVTIVGIPFGLGVISALNVLAPLGYVASALILGRLMVKGTSTGARIGAFFAGFGILRAAALLPALGFIVWFLVCIYGLGALAQAAWRAGRRAPEEPSSTQPSDPQPVAPAAPTD